MTETPALLLHLDVVERNLATMAGRAKRLGIALRPHIKTHKSVDLGRRQLAHGARGVTVSTLDEAEAFADAGFDDILWAFPIDPGHIPHARRVAERTRLGVVVDDLDTARALRNTGLAGWVKVDCGYHRAGVDPASAYALDVARALTGPGATFGGIVSHSGHAYKTRGRAEAAAVAEEERRVMTALADRLRGLGLEVPAVSVGSTPSMMALERGDGLTEGRPGNYVFFDRTMVEIGVCEPRDVGVTVLATVVSHQPGSKQVIVDAGALALSKDVGPTHLGLAPAMGVIRDHPELTIVSLSQEHGVVHAKSAGEIEGRFKVGETVEIVPNHSCLTVAHFDHYHVLEGGKETASWAIARGRQT
ncbi:MAG TPA: alanine racemase [Gemmatimonadales bacterium]|jgi:D-serine deaminase-like pyridoxal phosphate-dependent protein|nr:alanine racemase [Gemmatimonadales bacterium]